MSKEKNVFISHHGADDASISELKDLLAKRGYTIKNSSIDSSKPNEASNENYIKKLLSDRIAWAGVVLCLIGPKTHERTWVDWELEQAHRQGKPIYGIFLQGAKDADVPENLENYGFGLVGWNTDKIIDAIEGKDVGWCNAVGESRAPANNLRRIDC